ncbi:MAG TPA: cell division protein FtsQ/DivIB [Baekduia sp.]|uniref:cell division protein FtsQ/DivIB n=1 Tax=Baekduia sp. TaxID=2600305 RepID=UPI002C80797B|nr:cell division protein FtsQ/DivIB [Baekduia sp.]HMJ37391.1 cell division protein FtsQ/DivIB [Baekduia sp.]
MHRAAALPRTRAVPRLPRTAVWVLAVLALLVAGGLWLRDSQLVAVNQVTVTGLTSPDSERVANLLENAARDMTTLHVRQDQLDAVVAPFPVVKAVEAEPDLPHGMRITVVENTAVAVVMAGGKKTPVAGNGLLLPDAAAASLPIVPLKVPATGDHVVDRAAMQGVAALAAAPAALRERVLHTSVTRQGGLTLTLRDGPELRFGGADRLAAKWAAASAVLADTSSAGASYLDLRYPERPAAGGLEDPATQSDPDAVNAAEPPAATTQVTPAPGIAP